MAAPDYKIPATEVSGSGQPFPQEIALSGANVSFSPPAGFTADNVQDAIIQGPKVLTVEYTTSESVFSTSSTTFVTDTALTVTPTAGTWEFQLSASFETTGVNVEGEIALFKNGVQITNTTREINVNTAILGLITLSTCSQASSANIVTSIQCNGTDVITVRTRMVAGAGAVQVYERCLRRMQTGV